MFRPATTTVLENYEENLRKRNEYAARLTSTDPFANKRQARQQLEICDSFDEYFASMYGLTSDRSGVAVAGMS
jgi:hypothetical protein